MDVKLKIWGNKATTMDDRYCNEDSKSAIERRRNLFHTKEELEAKTCLKCGKTGAISSTYCECGGLLLDNKQYHAESKIQTKNALMDRLLQNPEVQQAIKKALMEIK